MIISRAPLRIPFGGGGTDLPHYQSQYGGFILSAAINKYVFINVNRPEIRENYCIKYSKTEVVDRIEDIKHDLVREALKLLDVQDRIEISAMADVPAGTGMGSSGTFTVALLTALHAFKRKHAQLRDIAEEACHIEIEKLSHPSGKHDQYLAAFGGLTCLEIDTSGKVKVEPMALSYQSLDELRSNLFLFYTGIKRSSSEVLQDQNQGVKKSDSMVVESYHEIKEIGRMIKSALEKSDFDGFGRLMNQHWEVKKRTSKKVSTDFVDRLYDLGLKNGAIGGKLMGAGGGGFMMFYCPNENGRARQLRDAMTSEGLKEMPFDFDTQGAKVVFDMA